MVACRCRSYAASSSVQFALAPLDSRADDRGLRARRRGLPVSSSACLDLASPTSLFSLSAWANTVSLKKKAAHRWTLSLARAVA